MRKVWPMKKIFHKILSPFERYITAELFWMTSKYLKAKSKNPGLKPIRWLIRKNIELLINRMKLARRDNSFANESATLENILGHVNIERKFLVDIGAADGIRQSSTALFLNQYGWEGALFEYDADSFARLAFLYNDRSDLKLCKSKVTPINIASLLEGLNVPRDFGYLNIDIDSYDLSVLRSMIEAGFNPSVISMEINENFDVNLYFEVLWNEEHSWNVDHFFGCSLGAAHATLEQYGYVLARMEYNNAIFVREPKAANLVLPSSLKQAYWDGYLNKSNRQEMFPWNKDLEFLHSNISIEEKIESVNQLFRNYQGKYILRNNS